MAKHEQYYHGSYDYLAVHTTLRGRGELYAQDWSGTSFYAALEYYRPAECIAHCEAVFMVSSPDDLDNAGAPTEWCSEVEPLGDISRHDMNWSSDISCLIGDGLEIGDSAVRLAAEAYWRGDPHEQNDPVWEYLSREAKVIRCEQFEEFEVCLSTNNESASFDM